MPPYRFIGRYSMSPEEREQRERVKLLAAQRSSLEGENIRAAVSRDREAEQAVLDQLAGYGPAGVGGRATGTSGRGPLPLPGTGTGGKLSEKDKMVLAHQLGIEEMKAQDMIERDRAAFDQIQADRDAKREFRETKEIFGMETAQERNMADIEQRNKIASARQQYQLGEMGTIDDEVRDIVEVMSQKTLTKDGQKAWDKHLGTLNAIMTNRAISPEQKLEPLQQWLNDVRSGIYPEIKVPTKEERWGSDMAYFDPATGKLGEPGPGKFVVPIVTDPKTGEKKYDLSAARDFAEMSGSGSTKIDPYKSLDIANFSVDNAFATNEMVSQAIKEGTEIVKNQKSKGLAGEEVTVSPKEAIEAWIDSRRYVRDLMNDAKNEVQKSIFGTPIPNQGPGASASPSPSDVRYEPARPSESGATTFFEYESPYGGGQYVGGQQPGPPIAPHMGIPTPPGDQRDPTILPPPPPASQRPEWGGVNQKTGQKRPTEPPKAPQAWIDAQDAVSSRRLQLNRINIELEKTRQRPLYGSGGIHSPEPRASEAEKKEYKRHDELSAAKRKLEAEIEYLEPKIDKTKDINWARWYLHNVIERYGGDVEGRRQFMARDPDTQRAKRLLDTHGDLGE